MIHNERTKLLANALNRASVVCFVAGVAPPAASAFNMLGDLPETLPAAILALGSATWLSAAVALHLFAQRVLGRLQ